MKPTANMPSAAVTAAARKLVVATLTMASSPGFATQKRTRRLATSSTLALHDCVAARVGLVTID